MREAGLTTGWPLGKIERVFASDPLPEFPPLTRPDRPVGGADVHWQASLFGMDDPSIDGRFTGIERRWLDDECWIDHLPRWLSGADNLFAELVARLPWRQRVVRMYDRLVDEPRLTWWWSVDDAEAPLPLSVMAEAAIAVSARYGRTFDSVGVNFYRDGEDSVAWHADRVRFTHVDPIVVIVSVGAPRPFLIRPAGGGIVPRVPPRPGGPAGHGGSDAAGLAAHRAQGERRRPPDQHHLPPRHARAHRRAPPAGRPGRSGPVRALPHG